MKYLLTLFLFTTAVLAFGQSSVDFRQITNSWTQGKIDQTGKVIQADINRGGWYQLKINKDSTVVFDSPDMCGFGFPMRDGRWTIIPKDTSITFSFSRSIGKMAYPGIKDINEIEIYKIKKLTSHELILSRIVDGNERTMPFICL